MLKIAVIGAGGIASAYGQALGRSERARLAGVTDIDPAAAARFAETFGTPAYATVPAMQMAERFDAAIVCTPPDTHEAIVLDLVRRGIHVLCEKPLSIDRASAVRMIAAAQAAGVVLTMGSKYRYVADVVRARELVNAGTIGDVILFENVFTSYVDMRSRWNSDPRRSGGGALIDLGTHCVDIVRYFMGSIDKVHAIEGKRSQGLPVEETVHLFVKNHDGVMGTIDMSWSIQKNTESFIDIYGSHGTISVGWKQSRYRTTGGEWTKFGDGYDKVAAFRAQIDNFAGAIAGTEALVIGPEDALASVEVIQTIYVSLVQDEWLAVPHFDGAAEATSAPS